MTDSLACYFKDIKRYKVLDKETMNELIIKAHNGDNRAKDKVINANLKFVVLLANKFKVKGMNVEDLISSGNIGLVKAVERFNPELNVPFTSYASYWIEQAMYKLIYDCRNTIRLPLTQRVIANKIAKATNEYIKENGATPSSSELSTILNIPVAKIDFLAKFNNKTASLDEPIGNGEDEYSQLQDMIASDYNLEEEVNIRLISKLLNESTSLLNNREHDVLCLLYGIYETSLSLKEVSDIFGVSKERIRQIRDKALTRLKEKFQYLENDLFSK